MRIKEFSKKQAEVLKFAKDEHFALICDGSVRSGKTVVMIMAYIIWAMSKFDRCNFAICGKTIASTERNVIQPLRSIEGMPYSFEYKLSNRVLTVKCGKIENYFYVFGGKDESSYMLIQGVTLAGVFFDEVVLMPRSFVEQAIARTLTFKKAKLWFNCNPDNPKHWFYTEWVNPKEDLNVKRLHFLMTDNPTLSDEEIKKAESLFSGVFYDRYILGKWVPAEGIIYPLYANNPEAFYIDRKDVPKLEYINIGVDFGGNKSNHAFVATGIDADYNLYVLKSESIEAKGMPVETLTDKVKAFCEEIEAEYGFIDIIYPDNAEQTIINSLRMNLKWYIKNSLKKPILDRIRCTDIMMSKGRLKLVKGKNQALEDGLCQAVWDGKQNSDTRLDDGTSDIDILDAFEYSFEKYIKRLIKE